jgi:transketolase
MPTFPADPKGIATRVASGKVMNAIAPRVTALVGGSTDLDPSTHTALNGFGDFNPPAGREIDTQGSSGGGWSYAGRNLHPGVREHAMGAIVTAWRRTVGPSRTARRSSSSPTTCARRSGWPR